MAAWRHARALTLARSLCGCSRLAAAESLTGDAEEMERTTGEHLAAQWGCPARGHTPPPTLPDSAALPLGRTATHAARAAGLSEPPQTCPFACLERASPYTLRVLRAVVRSGETLRIPVAASLPHMTAADDTAVDAWLTAHHAAEASDEAARERDRQAQKQKP